MSVPAVIVRILDNMDKRRSRAERVFARFAEDAGLPRMLGAKTSWAVVGGAVRDCILAEGEEYLETLFVPWPDVDVAVAASVFSLSDADLDDARFQLSVNSFGGWKATLPGGAELDVWRVPASVRGQLSLQRWHDYLGSVDFSINAVAFVWPQRQIVMHPRWTPALRSRCIEKLAVQSPRQELQPVRAIALGAKLQTLTGCKFRLGKLISRDLEWLLAECQAEQRQEAVSYLKRKTSSGRWSRQSLAVFFGSATAAADHPALLRCLADAIGVSIEGQRRLSRVSHSESSGIRTLW